MKNWVFPLVLIGLFLLLPGESQAATNSILAIRDRMPYVFSLNAQQIDSVAAIVRAFTQFGDGDTRKLAYMLGTAWHESRLKPIKEIKAQEGTALWDIQRKYWYSGYYGRGFVQITWEDNYRKLGQRLGVDLVGNPDLALQTDVAAKILVVGMLEGMFTGKRLDAYINSMQADFYNARRTVGAIYVLGKDTAALIEGYTKQILA